METPQITVYTMAYNEEFFLPFMVNHYRKRFPGCPIVVYDNESTDGTVEIAKYFSCAVRPHQTGGQVNDVKLTELKNNCWKDALTDWVVVCDVDELLDIDRGVLQQEASRGASIVRSVGYTMVNRKDNLDVLGMTYGYRDERYDKTCLFNKGQVEEIGYEPGAHECRPRGRVRWSSARCRLLHYKYVHPELYARKNRYTVDRFSEVNKDHGWGAEQWGEASDEKIRQMFAKLRAKSVKIH